jgi:hypothetical protein
MNYLLVEALERYHHFYGEGFKVECPYGSGQYLTLQQDSNEIARRLSSTFLPDENGHRPCHGGDSCYATDPNFRDLILFHEYFHGDNGHGVGASHQTGWTALVTRCLEDLASMRRRPAAQPVARKREERPQPSPAQPRPARPASS